MISDAALNEFKEIWKAEFGSVISDELAIEEATSLLSVFNAVYRPLKKHEVDEYDRNYAVGKSTENLV